MLNWDKPLQTVAGHPARVICKDRKHCDRPEFKYVVLITHVDYQDSETVVSVNEDGKFSMFTTNPYDIINVVEKKITYKAVMDDHRGNSSEHPDLDYIRRIYAQDDDFVCLLKITREEGFPNKIEVVQ